VPVRDARVPKLVGESPVTLQRDDVGPPRLDAERDHASEDRRRFRGSQDWRARCLTIECAAMRALALVLAAVLFVAASAVSAQTRVEAARALVARYHEDPARLDRARDVLDGALAAERRIDMLVMLSHVQFLIGDVRATTPDEKLAAYHRGREIGRRAVELAPKNHEAHLWYAINTARWGETKGVLRSLFLLPTIREELTILLELD